MKTVLSIIVPALNEEENIESSLVPLQPLRQKGVEIILVDGGSSDQTCELAAPYVDQLFHSERGRARQMNAGAALASGTYCLFLHADTKLPSNFSMPCGNVQWGFFSVKFSGAKWPLRIIEWCMNTRSRVSGIATGDQVIFVRGDIFRRLGGYAEIPLMEDIDLCRRLKGISPPILGKGVVTTSSRRWEQRGIVRTVLTMWSLRLAYFMGVSPQYLARQYYP